MTTLGAMMDEIRAVLKAAGIDDPMAEARIIVGGLLGFGRTDFVTKSGEFLAQEDEDRIRAAIGRRAQGEPPYRILGRRPFYGLDFKLSKGTLEPRPDTEILVDTVLAMLATRRSERLRILDLGTGTGAICLALLSELPNSSGIGTDLSTDALARAAENASLNGLADRFGTVRSRWFDAVRGTYDVIVSNPPYIRSGVIPLLDREVREHDPLLALDGGEDGLEAYRDIAAGARPHLEVNGLLAVETGFDQRSDVEIIFRDEGFSLARAEKDYGGNDRVQVFVTKI